MDDRGKITPEKQLLNIIEDPKSEAKWGQRKTLRSGASWFSLGALKGRLSFWKGVGAGKSQELRRRSFSIVSFNRTLMMFVFGLGVFLVISFAKSIIEVSSQPVFDSPQIKGQSATESLDPEGYIKPLPQVLAKVRNRDIFKMGQEKKEETPTPETPTVDPRAEAMEATSHLKLVGISWSEDPDAMIEDSKAVRTFFVKKGQRIGKVSVTAILKDKIMLEYNGQEVELK